MPARVVIFDAHGTLFDVNAAARRAVAEPGRAVHDMAGTRFARPADDVLLVSSNGWDVCNATACGFPTVWVNRAGLTVDRIGVEPGHVVSDRAEVPNTAAGQ